MENDSRADNPDETGDRPAAGKLSSRGHHG